MNNTPKPIERLLLKEHHGDRHDSYLSWEVMYGRDVMVNIKVVKQGMTSNYYVTLPLPVLKQIPATLRMYTQEQRHCSTGWNIRDSAQARPPEVRSLYIRRDNAGEVWLIITNSARGDAKMKVDPAAYADLFDEVFTEMGWFHHEKQPT